MSRTHKELIVYENMENHITVKEFCKQCHDNEMIKGILFKITKDLELMIENSLYFRDFHFENVMTDYSGNICWIDTNVAQITCSSTLSEKVNKKFSVLNAHQKRDPWLSLDEWNFFKQQIPAVVV